MRRAVPKLLTEKLPKRCRDLGTAQESTMSAESWVRRDKGVLLLSLFELLHIISD